MAEEIKNEATTAQPVAKKNRRGLGNARGTNRLKFDHKDAKGNGLFLGHLDTIELKNIKIGEDTTGMPSFNGLEIPRLLFTFASNEPEVAKRKFVTLQFQAQESNIETIPGGSKAWAVDSVFNWLKHIIVTYLPTVTEEQLDVLALPFDDTDDEGQYVQIDPETVVAGWKEFFENVYTLITTGSNGKPIYQDANGKAKTVWMKLLRHIKTGKGRNAKWKNVGNNGDLGFPAIVGEGCIELYKANTMPALRVNVLTESIQPKQIEEAKTPNVGVQVGGGFNAMGGVPVSDPMAQGFEDMGGIGMEAAEDMPF